MFTQWHYRQRCDILVEKSFLYKGDFLEPFTSQRTTEIKEDHPNKNKQRIFIQSLL